MAESIHSEKKHSGMMAWMPSCAEVTRLASEAMERKLSLKEKMLLQIHLSMCALCRRYERQLGILHASLHKHPDKLIAPESKGLSPEAKERIAAAIQESSRD